MANWGLAPGWIYQYMQLLLVKSDQEHISREMFCIRHCVTYSHLSHLLCFVPTWGRGHSANQRRWLFLSVLFHPYYVSYRLIIGFVGFEPKPFTTNTSTILWMKCNQTSGKADSWALVKIPNAAREQPLIRCAHLRRPKILTWKETKSDQIDVFEFHRQYNFLEFFIPYSMIINDSNRKSID